MSNKNHKQISIMKVEKTNLKDTILNELVLLLDKNNVTKNSFKITQPYVMGLSMLMDKTKTDKNSFVKFYSSLLKLETFPLIHLDSIEYLMNNYKRNPDFLKHINMFCSCSSNLSLPVNVWKSFIFTISTLNTNTKYFELKTKLYIKIITSNLEVVKNYNLDSFCKNIYNIKDELIEKRIGEILDSNTAIKAKDRNELIYQSIFGLLLYWTKKIMQSNVEVHINLSRLFEVHFTENKKWINMSTEIEEFLEFMDTKLPAGYLMNNFTQTQIEKLAVVFRVKKELFLNADVTTEELMKAQFILEPFFKKFIIPKVFFKSFFGLDSNQHALFLHVLEGKSIHSYSSLPLHMDKKSCHMLLDEIITKDYRLLNKTRKNLWDYFAMARILASSSKKISEIDIHLIIVSYQRYGGSYDFWIENLLLIDKKHDGRIRICMADIADYLYNKVLVKKEQLDLKSISLKTLVKRMKLWHLELMKEKLENVILPKSEIRNFYYQENQTSKLFIIRQLYNSYELHKEGKDLNHCVRTYDRICLHGKTFIFSLRIVENEIENSLITIEVRDGKIFQAKGKYNRPANVDEIKIIKLWAEEENLDILCIA